MIITKKPKKKRIIYKEESDSEEEVVIKSKPKPKPSNTKIPLLQFFKFSLKLLSFYIRYNAI